MRFLLYLLAGLFATPALASAVLWVRSYRVSDDLVVEVEHREAAGWKQVQRGLFSGRGRLVYYQRSWSVNRSGNYRPRMHVELNHVRVGDARAMFIGKPLRGEAWGFVVLDEVWGEIGARAVIVPLWAVVGACGLAAVPFLMMARRGRMRAYRRKNGLCIECGYDIRESRERCPECGWEVKGRKITGEAPVPR